MIRVHFLCLAFLGLVAHISGKELHKSVCTKGRKGEERREGGMEGRREGGTEEATERGIVSSHCSIKSVGNDQDEMMAIFLL